METVETVPVARGEFGTQLKLGVNETWPGSRLLELGFSAALKFKREPLVHANSGRGQAVEMSVWLGCSLNIELDLGGLGPGVVHVLALVTPAHDVIDGAGILDSELARHGAGIPRMGSNVKAEGGTFLRSDSTVCRNDAGTPVLEFETGIGF